MNFRLLSALAGCSAFLSACRVDPVIPEAGSAGGAGVGTDISFRVPPGWPAPAYNFSGNPLTPEGFALGRKLFFDPVLSRDSSTSCGSCHQAPAAFAHAAHEVSHGIEGQVGLRNSPGLFNLAWHSTGLMWDGAGAHLEVQPIIPITARAEMDETLDGVLRKIARSADYRRMFAEAFGSEEVTSQRLLRAMAQFMGALVSADAKWDRVQRGVAQFTASEAAGERVFKQRCASCHVPPLFTDFSFRSNGLPLSTPPDSGRGRLSGEASELYRFKVPSLRNLGYTAPYMHHGRVPTLEAVLDHYTTGIPAAASPATDPALAGGIVLSATERADLLQFLSTLNDEAFVKDPRFAPPQ